MKEQIFYMKLLRFVWNKIVLFLIDNIINNLLELHYPLSCLIANFFIGNIEVKLQSENKLPKTWFRYIVDVFTVLGKEKVDDFLTMLNSLHKNISFTVKQKTTINCLFWMFY